jgi:hypothetical protein
MSTARCDPHDDRSARFKRSNAPSRLQLRLYGVLNAFRDGRMPSNAQIDQTLTYVLGHSPIDEKALSRDGRKLIEDVRDIIETSQTMVREKNADELFQNFVWHTRDVNVDRAKKDPDAIKPVDGEKVNNDANEGE